MPTIKPSRCLAVALATEANAAVCTDDEHLVIVAADGANLSYTVTAVPQ